jgi:hypothetical protein
MVPSHVSCKGNVCVKLGNPKNQEVPALQVLIFFGTIFVFHVILRKKSIFGLCYPEGVCLSIYLSIDLSIYRSIDLSIYLSMLLIHVCMYVYIHIYIYTLLYANYRGTEGPSHHPNGNGSALRSFIVGNGEGRV